MCPKLSLAQTITALEFLFCPQGHGICICITWRNDIQTLGKRCSCLAFKTCSFDSYITCLKIVDVLALLIPIFFYHILNLKLILELLYIFFVKVEKQFRCRLLVIYVILILALLTWSFVTFQRQTKTSNNQENMVSKISNIHSQYRFQLPNFLA